MPGLAKRRAYRKLRTHPDRNREGKECRAIRKAHGTIARRYCSHVLLLAAIPAVAGHRGTTQVGSMGRKDAPEIDVKGFLQETLS